MGRAVVLKISQHKFENMFVQRSFCLEKLGFRNKTFMKYVQTSERTTEIPS